MKSAEQAHESKYHVIITIYRASGGDRLCALLGVSEAPGSDRSLMPLGPMVVAGVGTSFSTNVATAETRTAVRGQAQRILVRRNERA